ncbi:hypothetical protein BH10BAC2_BH10BAC2_06420 [soil metagenome]
MPVTKKHTAAKKVKATKTVIVTKKKLAPKSLFPEKLEKVNNLLSKSSLLNS